MRKHILILGGTAEAREIAQLLASRKETTITLSLAGRTAIPAALPVPVRSGGFGGPQGLAQYLHDHQVDALIDATHPYAAQISRHAREASLQTNTPLMMLRRAPWRPVDGDQWTEVLDVPHAVRSLGTAPRKVFLAIGRQEISHFAGAPQHRYLIRSVDPVVPPLAVPHAQYILDRGPFTQEKEAALLLEHAIDVVVAKNSGGPAAYPKIAAARALRLPVLMLRRPPESQHDSAACVADVIAWLDHVPGTAIDRGV